MATRQQIIQRARELIQAHPTWGKDKINRELKTQYGSGLRRSEVARLKRSIIPPTVQEQTQLVLRYQKLRNEGFLPEEAQYYSRFPISHTGMQKVRRFRKSEIRQARQYGISNMDAYIRESYSARGLVTPDGKLKPDDWNKEVYYELEQKPKDRRTVVIPPDRYDFYIKARRGKVRRSDALRLSERIPRSQWDKRIKQYNTLRKAHFSHWEALKIVTTLTKPEEGKKRKLQDLDLTNPAWKEMIADRIAYHKQQIQRLMAKGLNRQQAEKAFITELNNYYKRRSGDTRTDPTPWDWLREYYKFRRDLPQSDFVTNKQLRQDRFTKKKMPFRAR